MLKKAVLEVVTSQSPGFYSCLFLLRRPLGCRETSHQSLAIECLCSVDKIQDGDSNSYPILH